MVFDPRIDSSENRKLQWRFYGPFRIVDIEGVNAKVQPIDKPRAKPEWLPLDRLGPIPEDCTLPTEGAKARGKLIQQSHSPDTTLSSSVHVGCDLKSSDAKSQSSNCSYVPATSPSLPSAAEAFPQSGKKMDRALERLELSPVRETVSRSRVIFVPLPFVGFCDSSDYRQISFANTSTAFCDSVERYVLGDDVKEVLVMLPSAQGDRYVEEIQHAFHLLSMNSRAEFLVLPPPPSYDPAYGAMIDVLVGPHTELNFVTNPSYRGRTLLSYGFTGSSLNQHEAKGGLWTKVGLYNMKKFLVECLNYRWPFLLPGDFDPTAHARLRSPPDPLRPPVQVQTVIVPVARRDDRHAPPHRRVPRDYAQGAVHRRDRDLPRQARAQPRRYFNRSPRDRSPRR
jgi:hypothetical protein